MTQARAEQLLESREFLESAREFSKILNSRERAVADEQRVPLLLGRAKANFNLKLYRRCLADCNEVLQLQPCLPEAVRVRAVALFSMNKYAHVESFLTAFFAQPDCDESTELCQALKTLLGHVQGILDGASSKAEKQNKNVQQGKSMPAPAQDRSAIEFSFETKVMLVKVGYAQQTQTPQRQFDIIIDDSRVASLKSAAAQMDYPTGEFDRDVKVLLSYLLVNNHHFDEAIPLLDTILNGPKAAPDCFAALLSRGTAKAMKGGGAGGIGGVSNEEARELLISAAKDFRKAAEVKPENAGAFMKLGQVLMALGQDEDARTAYTNAIDLGPKGHLSNRRGAPAEASQMGAANAQHLDCQCQRGILNKRLGDFELAVLDLQGAVCEKALRTPGQANTVYQLAIALNNVGRCEEAIEMYTQVQKMTPDEALVCTNIAECHRQLGNGVLAVSQFEKSLKIDPTLMRTYQLFADCHYHMGNFLSALRIARAGLEIANTPGQTVNKVGYDKDLRCIAGLSLHGLGRFSEADQIFSALIAEQPDHYAWFFRELLRYFAAGAVKSPEIDWTMPIAGKLQGELKLASTRKPPARQWKAAHPEYELQPADACQRFQDASSVEDTSERSSWKRLTEKADLVGQLLQLRCKGFLSNRVQQRQFGLAVLQMAQHIRQAWTTDVENREPHDACGDWRSTLQIAANWRQVSEPNTSVWWLDETPAEDFAAGFGLETLIESGQLKIIRYHPYCDMSFQLAKTLTAEQCALTDELREQVLASSSPRHLRQIMGHDFWVVNRCVSNYVDGRVMEGTRLIFEKRDPRGIKYGIQIASTPARWKQFDEELRLLWKDLCRSFREARGTNTSPSMRVDSIDEEYARLSQRFFFFWVNFAPLSRGSAATGYAALFALMLAYDKPKLPCGPIADGVQLDWECILRHNSDDIAAATLEEDGPLFGWYSRWFGPAHVVLQEKDIPGAHVIDSAIPPVAECTKTLSSALAVLHLGLH